MEVTPDRSDPGFALWAWCQVQLDRSALPAGRVLVAFTFPDERPGNRRYWLLIEHGEAEVCYTDPGGQPDLSVEARSQAFVDWHRGARSWRDVLRSGDIGCRPDLAAAVVSRLERASVHLASGDGCTASGEAIPMGHH